MTHGQPRENSRRMRSSAAQQRMLLCKAPELKACCILCAISGPSSLLSDRCGVTWVCTWSTFDRTRGRECGAGLSDACMQVPLRCRRCYRRTRPLLLPPLLTASLICSRHIASSHAAGARTLRIIMHCAWHIVRRSQCVCCLLGSFCHRWPPFAATKRMGAAFGSQRTRERRRRLAH